MPRSDSRGHAWRARARRGGRRRPGDRADGRRGAPYFHVALPLHSLDENASLAPRLFAAGAPGDLAEALRDMSAQHVEINGAIQRLLPLWSRLAVEPGALDSIRHELAAETARLDALWDIHLALEESFVFPHIARDLDEAARAEIVKEMRERRSDPTLSSRS